MAIFVEICTWKINLNLYVMKKRSVLYTVLSILVSYLAGCVNEQEDKTPLENRELEQFFSYHSKGEAREVVSDLQERGVLCVINTLCNWDEILSFIRMFKTDYGQPLWDHSVFISCEDKYVLYVPAVKQAIDSEIETIWTFYIKGDTLYHFPLVRTCDFKYVEEYWKFDYFTTYALGKEPADGLKFHNFFRSTTPPGPDVNCTHAYVVIGGVTYDKGIHCWWDDEGSDGGNHTPGTEFPPQPILPEDAPGGGGSGGVGPVYDPVINKIASTITLTEKQIEKLREAIGVMEDICMVDALMGEMKSQGKTISIVDIDPQISAKGEACYKPSSNTLSFSSEDKITPQALLHEYFHFYQTQKNKGIVSGKNGVMEIERNIYYDIVFTCMFLQSNTDYGVWTYQPDATLNNCMTGENYDNYGKWLKNIYNTLKNGETVTITSKDLEDWGDLYKKNTTNSVYKTYDYSAANYVVAINDALNLNLSNNCIK